MCKDDYPYLLEELEKEPFDSVLDCGCGTGPVIELLHEKYPDKHYTGLDLTPEMIRVAQAKNLSNTNFVVGDCENIPFPEDTFDAIISSNSFHHYPNPQDFFNNAYRVLKKNGRLILRDYTTKSKVLLWLCNHIEMPLAHLCGHGDVRLYSGAEFKSLRKLPVLKWFLSRHRQKCVPISLLVKTNIEILFLVIPFKNRRLPFYFYKETAIFIFSYLILSGNQLTCSASWLRSHPLT